MRNTGYIQKKEFDRIFARVPRLCVEVLIVDRKNGIVLTKRSIGPAKGKWHLPGGTVRFKEKLKNAVKRVALAETGLKVEVESTLGIIEYHDFKGYGGYPVSICFMVKSSGGLLKHDNNASDIGFFKKMPVSMVKEHKKFIIDNINL